MGGLLMIPLGLAAQAATHWKWKHYLQQQFLGGKPLVTTPHTTLPGTASFNHKPTLGETLPLGDTPTSPTEEAPSYDELIEKHKDAWFTDGSATCTATRQRQWRPVATLHYEEFYYGKQV